VNILKIINFSQALKNKKLILFFLLISKIIFSANLFDFATFLYNENDYYRAISEFQRFIFYFPNDKKVDEAYLYIVKSYYFGKQYKNVIESSIEYKQKINNQIIKEKLLFYLANGYLFNNNYKESYNLFKEIAQTSVSTNLREISQLRLYWVYIFQMKWKEALNEILNFEKNNTSKKFNTKLELLKKDLEKGINFKGLSPTLAALLSAVLPGAGQVYTKRIGDGLVALTFISIITYGTYYYYKNGPKEISFALGILDLIFYAGNIYTAFSSANKYNKNFNIKLKDELFNNYFEDYDL